jgi:hypothetical protein
LDTYGGEIPNPAYTVVIVEKIIANTKANFTDHDLKNLFFIL